MKHTNIIFFVGGAVIGALGGFFSAKTHYQKIYEKYAEETVNEMREVLYRTPPAEEAYEGDEINPVMTEETSPTKTWTKEREAEIRRRLNMNREGTNYAAMYGRTRKTEEDDEESEDEDDLEEEEPEIVSHYEKNKGRKPHLISADASRELPDGTDFKQLQFYNDDGVLADGDTEERISDISLLLGDCLTKYDFVGSDEPVIYVMNEELSTCYEVVRIPANYEETHPDE